MKLLLITQKVDRDDQVLGFFHRWLEMFATHVEQLTVICLEEGNHSLPQNVQVYSLGKEQGAGRMRRLYRLYRYVWKYRGQYTHVFVHMNPVYVVLCWKLWFVLRKPVFLWYTHKHVDCKLRVASWFVRSIFTASTESLRLRTRKKVVTGHGIDTDFFTVDSAVVRQAGQLLTVGRIAPAKRIDVLIDALTVLPDMTLSIAGGPITDADRAYERACKERAVAQGVVDRVRWLGPVSHGATRSLYQQAGVFVHASETGSLDKVLLEAIACGTPVVSASDVAASLPGVVHVARTPEAIRAGILGIGSSRDTAAAEEIRRVHGLPSLIERLCAIMEAHV
ncbi:MAG: hypothetical protein RL150_483 [Candidatus Parcubacteria bacterium]|jgi:glycosyltransferase involved in cell wall biosynthesis